MYTFTKTILFSVRMVALVSAVGKVLIAVGALLGLAAYSNEVLLDKVINVLGSTPVFGLIMLILGQWLGETFDVLTYRIEGGVGGPSARHLRLRMRYARSLLNKPRWYPNEDRIVREIERTDQAMVAAGFASLGKWRPDHAKSNAQTADYLRACSALIKKMGMRKASCMNGALQRQLKSKACAPFYE
jgi:hypothetical protein